jgi:hypothetical protein
MNPVPRPLVQRPSCPARREANEAIAAATPIRLAPEPDALENAILLGDHETTGPLPIGFPFDLFGVRYTHFDLSSDGFLGFGWGSARGPHHLTLGGANAGPLGAGLLAFELRGAAPRRRLVVSFAGAPRPGGRFAGHAAAQIILHERTGMIEIHGAPVGSEGG